jgi:hypothetical protein
MSNGVRNSKNDDDDDDDDDETSWQKQLVKELQQNDADNNNNKNSHSSESPSSSSSSSLSSSSSSMMAAGGVMAGVSLLLIGLQFPFLFPKSAPYMATPGHKIRHALQFLNKTKTKTHHANQTQSSSSSSQPPPPVFVDLGSGDGQAVYEAARLGYRAIGIEFNWTLWAISSLRRRLFWTSQERALSSFRRQDFISYNNLKEADTVMIFAIPKTMPILGTKIQLECRPGTDILAYRFGIPLAVDKNDGKDNGDAHPTGSSQGNDDDDIRLCADLIYDREDMRIYRMKKDTTTTASNKKATQHVI